MIESRLVVVKAKSWGTTQTILRVDDFGFEVHRICIRKEGRCSIHYHPLRANEFYIENGKLDVMVYDGIGLDRPFDMVTLQNGERFIVPAGVQHSFFAREETIAYEIYWPYVSNEDIVRL